jgi:RimJ/RimL family protein N-acetyltransferase
VDALNYFQDNEITISDIIQEDVISLFTWWVDKEINKYDPRPIPSNSFELLKECECFCKRFEKEVINIDLKQRKYKYFIIRNDFNQAIGFVNIFSFDAENKQCELGIEIGDKRYWRKGLASKAVSIVTDYIFNNMDIKRIYIETGEANIPAIRLFEKLEFTKCDELIDEGFKFIVMEKNGTHI